MTLEDRLTALQGALEANTTVQQAILDRLRSASSGVNKEQQPAPAPASKSKPKDTPAAAPAPEESSAEEGATHEQCLDAISAYADAASDADDRKARIGWTTAKIRELGAPNVKGLDGAGKQRLIDIIQERQLLA